MNVVLECDVVLSKKLEAVCENGEPISMHITSVSGNRGRAVIRITCADNVSENDLSKIGETSLMLKVNSVSEDIKSISDTPRVTNLVGSFSSDFEKIVATTNPDVAQKKIDDGLRHALESGAKQENNYVPSPSQSPVPEKNTSNPADTMKIILAALEKAGIKMPEMTMNQSNNTDNIASIPPTVPYKPPVKNVPATDNCIKNYDELMDEISKTPGIDKEIDIPANRKLTPQEAESIMTRLPRLRKKAFLRNNIQSQLLIADLFTTIDGGGACLSLLPGAVVDLSRIPAKNILNCNQLKWCFDTNKVELVNEAEFIASFKRLETEVNKWDQDGTLPVYSSRDNLGDELLADQSSQFIEVGGDPEHAPPPLYEDSKLMNSLLSELPTTR